MSERKAVESVIGRMYRDHLIRTGRLPKSRELKEMEKKAKKAAEESDNRKARK
ncbi:MAG: hypothetical protein HY893_03650 [Deltaproteobacteria bacterium]|nr:hypothetical protein [Deltaproteobacteria bacterium]